MYLKNRCRVRTSLVDYDDDGTLTAISSRVQTILRSWLRPSGRCSLDKIYSALSRSPDSLTGLDRYR
jgi:hypothetical protein